jgi:hypothetical protein
MKKLLSIIILGLFFIILGCEKDDRFQSEVQDEIIIAPKNVDYQEVPSDIPEATVLFRKPDREVLSVRSNGCDNPLTPDFFEATLYPGDSVVEIKEACIPPIPPKADILWSFDLTGSMGEELGNVQVNCENIASAINVAIPDSRSGLISHMDYQGNYSSCGYTASYGGGPDYPYSLDQPFTETWSDMHTALFGLSIGSGIDGPENYARPFYEAYSDPGIEWRDDAAKIVIAFLDAIPHDCDLGTGDDPGRDATMGTGDDLDFDQVLLDMANNDIHLVIVHSGYGYNEWESYAANPDHKITTYQINSDGTIPMVDEIEEFIVSIISGTTATVDELMLEVGNPEYAENVVFYPPMYTDVSPGGGPYTFEVTFAVPDDAEPGVYTFPIFLKGDGAVYDEQIVTITVPDRYIVPLDIKPTSCPNPFNMGANGVLPVAILGSEEFDVESINVSSILLHGVAPIRSNYEDVSAPVVDAVEACECTTAGPDGYVDLTLKFERQDIAAALEEVNDGDVIELTIEGETADGIAILGSDCIVIKKKGKK